MWFGLWWAEARSHQRRLAVSAWVCPAVTGRSTAHSFARALQTCDCAVDGRCPYVVLPTWHVQTARNGAPYMFASLYCAVLCCAVLCCAGAAELHVLDGAAQTIFVRANYSMEVGQTQGLCVTGRFTSAQACLEHAHLRIMQPPSPRRLAGRVGLVYSPCFRMRALTPLIPSTPSRFRMRALTPLIPSTPSRYRMRAPCSCLQTSDAERIGVDQVAKILASGKATGTEQREWWP
jgi:hypothetical protein